MINREGLLVMCDYNNYANRIVLDVAADLILMLKTVILISATLVIAYISRASLLAPRSHGFYRFFAWEAILGLALLNVEDWFGDPFSWHQVLSWILLTAALFPVILGMRTLRKRGRPDPQREDVPLVGLEKTTVLVTSGIYRHIRHPLYSSLLLLAGGVFFKNPSWLGGLLALAAAGFLLVTALVEERENVRYFGDVYSEYMRRTRRFIPFLF